MKINDLKVAPSLNLGQEFRQLMSAKRVVTDEKRRSLWFFDLRSIPALCGELPFGVAEVQFRSDLSHCVDIDFDAVADQVPALEDFMLQQ